MAMNRRDTDLQRVFTRRALLLGTAQIALFGLLAGRLYYLQVVESDKYALLADENRISMRLLSPRRGRILDRWGTELATNRRNYRVMIVAEQDNNDVAAPRTEERRGGQEGGSKVISRRSR